MCTHTLTVVRLSTCGRLNRAGCVVFRMCTYFNIPMCFNLQTDSYTFYLLLLIVFMVRLFLNLFWVLRKLQK